MTITQRVVNTLTVLRVRGRLAAEHDDNLDRFRHAVDAAAARGVDLAIDLSDVQSVDSEGIGELARALGRVSRRGGRLALVAPSPSVNRLLGVTKLDSVFHVLPSEQAAIEVLVYGGGGTRAPRALALL